MLNEWREFHEYTYRFSDEARQPKRIGYTTFTAYRKGTTAEVELNGLERFLTIIARYFLFHNDYRSEIDAVENAVNALRAWLWMLKADSEAGASDEISQIEQWLPSYVRHMFIKDNADSLISLPALKVLDNQSFMTMQSCIEILLSEKDPRKCLDAVDRIGEICSEYDSAKMLVGRLQKAAATLSTIQSKSGQMSFRQPFQYQITKNDYHMVSCRKIIHSAFTAGKLKRYYLVCRDPFFEKIIANKKKVSILSYKDRILKTTAMCLLKLRHTNFSSDRLVRAVPVNYTDLSNWLISSGRITYKSDLSIFTFEGRELFQLESYGGKMTKLRADQEWFSLCEWDLIEATDSDRFLDEYLETHKGYSFYCDEGSGKGLVHNKRYRRSENGLQGRGD